MGKARKLTPKQAMFCMEYLVDLNATQAAIRAGYSKKTAASQGQRLLKNVEIAKRLAQAQQNRADRLEVSADRVALELARVGFSSLSEIAEFDENGVKLKASKDLPEDAFAALSEVVETKDGTLKVKMHSKTTALELLGKYLGMYIDKLEIDDPNAETELRVIFVETEGEDDNEEPSQKADTADTPS